MSNGNDIKPWHREIPRRVTEYLSNGGLFNPELMDHEAVRNILIDARDVIEIAAREKVTPPPDSQLLAAARKVVKIGVGDSSSQLAAMAEAVDELAAALEKP